MHSEGILCLGSTSILKSLGYLFILIDDLNILNNSYFIVDQTDIYGNLQYNNKGGVLGYLLLTVIKLA